MTRSPVKVTARLTALPGRGKELQALLLGMAPHCRAEPGNLRWDIWRDVAEPDRYVLDELYRDSVAVEAHRETAHYRDYLSRIATLAERSALVLEPVAIL